MNIDEIVEANKATIRELAKDGIVVDEAYGSIIAGNKAGGIFVHCTGFIKLWTKDLKTGFEHYALFETTPDSEPFVFTTEDMRDLHYNLHKLLLLTDRFNSDGYEDYTDAD